MNVKFGAVYYMDTYNAQAHTYTYKCKRKMLMDGCDVFDE